MDGADHLDEANRMDALMSRLASLRYSNEFVDCVLELGAGGELIPIHAVLGAANSGYIMGALRHGEGTVLYNGRVVRSIMLTVGDVLGTVPAAGVRKLVDYWYTNKMKLDGLQDAYDVWIAADFLVTWKGVADKCCAHALDLLAVDNWAEVWTLGKFFKRLELRKAASKFAVSRFKEVVAHLHWKGAPLEAVREVIGHELLDVGSEDEVLSAAMLWAEGAESGGGSDALAELLSVVRLPQVSALALDKLRIHPLVSGSVECMQLLEEAAAWVPSSAGELIQRLWGPRFAYRSLVVVGRKVQRYDVATNTWAHLTPSVVYASGKEAAASLGGRVYLAGGMWNEASFQVRCFDHSVANGESAWVSVAMMGTARNMAKAASLNGFLYVAGGQDGGNHDLHSVERYSPASNAWEAVASMTSARYSHQLVALGDFLYAIGGAVDQLTKLATAERYDPATNSWTPIASMARARSSFAAAAMGGFLYVTGGLHISGLSSCERYDPASNTWIPIADLPEPRVWHALACLGGALYVVGGRTASFSSVSLSASTSPPWRYDASSNTWVVVPLGAGSAEMAAFFYEAVWTAL
jgi:N-acetylneuraminic acid mutarotase